MRIRNYLYKLYCFLHRSAKVLLRSQVKENFRMVSIPEYDFSAQNTIQIEKPYVNDIEIDSQSYIRKKDLFPVENIVVVNSNSKLKESYKKGKFSKLSFGIKASCPMGTWESFIEASVIPEGYKNEGLHYTGYILDNINEWCLPSWIWTNAALARMYCKRNNIEKATQISSLLLKQQLDCGGWIVRNDYTPNGAIPTLAPNDSAYIANNALLETYRLTNNYEYLKAARKCADWIISTARTDGLVWSGYDMCNKKWIKKNIIVDTGFTAGLFANLYEITKEKKYKSFLERFVNQFIMLFYNPSKKGFATSLDVNDKQVGGMFARGQAWALEGLIPAYSVLRTDDLKEVIEETIDNLLKNQLKNGGWAYNFSRPLLGEDCKGVAVLAKSLLEWYKIEPKNQIKDSAQRALEWNIKHTANNGVCRGGIFSFCMEGAVVHNLYSTTAFVYTSAYAIEVYDDLNN